VCFVGVDSDEATVDYGADAAPDGAVWVVDGEPEYHRRRCAAVSGPDAESIPRSQAREDGFAPCPLCSPDATTVDEAVAHPEVWVADGYPDYHRSGCSELNALPGEPVPYDQAVEDGFAPCATCAPDAAVPPDEPSAAAVDNPVWVVDGFPDYHRSECVELIGLPTEPVPFDQAVEDGFAPCGTCRPGESAGSESAEPEGAEPEGAEPTRAEPTRAEPTRAGLESAGAAPTLSTAPTEASSAVYFVPGRPRYHARDCLIIKGQNVQAVPAEQAARDGFLPCSLCQRAV
jgi:hypothetical protein